LQDEELLFLFPGDVIDSLYTAETIELLRDALDDIWAALRPRERAHTSKTMLAVCLLEMAAMGERDPARLRSGALDAVMKAGSASLRRTVRSPRYAARTGPRPPAR